MTRNCGKMYGIPKLVGVIRIHALRECLPRVCGGIFSRLDKNHKYPCLKILNFCATVIQEESSLGVWYWRVSTPREQGRYKTCPYRQFTILRTNGIPTGTKSEIIRCLSHWTGCVTRATQLAWMKPSSTTSKFGFSCVLKKIGIYKLMDAWTLKKTHKRFRKPLARSPARPVGLLGQSFLKGGYFEF